MTAENFVGDETVKCKPGDDFGDDVPPCTRNTALYIISSQQMLITCACFSISKPFRKEVYTNPLFLVSIILMAIYQTYLTFYIDDWSKDLFGFVVLPWNYRVQIAILTLADLVLSYTFEKFAITEFNKCWNKRREYNLKRQREQDVAKTIDRATLLDSHNSSVKNITSK